MAKRVDLLEDRTLLAANIAPVNSVPGSQTTQVNTPLGFTDFRDNLITTSDADAGLNLRFRHIYCVRSSRRVKCSCVL